MSFVDEDYDYEENTEEYEELQKYLRGEFEDDEDEHPPFDDVDVESDLSWK